MKLDGELWEEFHLTERYGLLLGLLGNHFVFTKMSFPDTEKKTGNFIHIPIFILVLSKKEDVIKEFPAANQTWYQSENIMVSRGNSYTIIKIKW